MLARLLSLLTAATMIHLAAGSAGAGVATTLPPQVPGEPAAGMRDAAEAPAPDGRISGATTIYTIGDPTGEEQLYLEYLNRARANPGAEGNLLRATTDAAVEDAYNYFQVDLGLMAAAFAVIAPAPPLAMNAKLAAAARAHSQDMLDHQFQGHNASDGTDVGGRLTAAGFDWIAYGENVYAYSKSVFYGHAGFEVDWGPGVGGMQVPPGHRVNIHNPLYREVGVGVVDGSNGNFGPESVTQDFSLSASDTPFITGVAYNDSNGNQFYDIGEGMGGVQVTVSGQPGMAVTASSGGYSFPVPGDGTYTVTFSSASGAVLRQATVAVSGGKNVKLDYVPTVGGGNVASVRITRIAPTSDGRVAIEFAVESGSANAFSAQYSNSVRGGWSTDANATAQWLGGNQYQIVCAGGAQRYYRISAH